MRSYGLVVIWIGMTWMLLFRFSEVSHTDSFMGLYAMVTCYIVYLVLGVWRKSRK